MATQMDSLDDPEDWGTYNTNSDAADLFRFLSSSTEYVTVFNIYSTPVHDGDLN